MKKIIKLVTVGVTILLLGGCFEKNNLENANINTTVYPIEFLTKFLYENNAEVSSIYPAGVDIETYKLNKKQIKEYSKGDLFIYNGLTNEKQIAKELINQNKKMLIIDVSYGLKYTHGIEELWLSPNNFLMLGKNIKEYLSEYVNNKYLIEEIEKNYLELEETMSVMDAELRNIALTADKEKKSKVIVTSSNVFKYLENYGFTVISLEDEENLTSNNLNTIKKNFKDSTHDSILMLKSNKKTELINSLVNDYKAKIIVVNEMYALDETEKNNNETYLSLMDEYIDNIRNIVLE